MGQLHHDDGPALGRATEPRPPAGQLTLNDFELNHSRATDPPTSPAAARTMTPEVRARQQAALLLALHRRPDGAGICQELADDVGALPNRAARRLGDLRDAGYVTLSGESRRAATGRLQMIHQLTDAGRREAARLAEAGGAP
jgi:hypothetical protein